MTVYGLMVEMIDEIAKWATDGIERYVEVARRERRKVGEPS